GVAPFARASGSSAALDRVLVEVRGDKIVVQSNPSWGGYPGADPGPVEVTLGTHDLTNASLIGSGSLAIDRVKSQKFALTIQGSGSSEIANIATDQLNVSLEGTANAKVSGRAGKSTALVPGVSTVDPRAQVAAFVARRVDARGGGPEDAQRRHRRRRLRDGRCHCHRHGEGQRLGP